MKISSLAKLQKQIFGETAPDLSMLRSWTDEGILVAEGGGISGKHRSYPEGEVVWSAIATSLSEIGLRGANLKAAIIALRVWNDNKGNSPIPEKGFGLRKYDTAMTLDRIAVVRVSSVTNKPRYSIVEGPSEVENLQTPHIQLSLEWIAQLLRPRDGSSNAVGTNINMVSE